MRKKLLLLILLALCLVFSASCAGRTEEASYTHISQEEAKRIMDEETDYVILDVRTADEYNESHIEGAVLIPYDEIPAKAESILKDKEQKILVYCRSGNRSKKGSASLAKLGYTNVLEFGGISTWPYGTVK